MRKEKSGFERNLYDADPKTCRHFFSVMKTDKKREICVYCRATRVKATEPGKTVTK